MANDRGPSPALLRRWESLRPGVQAAISFPLLAIVLFAVNVGIFNQPLARSVLYGLIEALPLTALLLVATANERAKRRAPADSADEGSSGSRT